MGRPTSSEVNRAATLAFAKMITINTNEPEDQIARRGACSIFSVLLATCPQVIRGGTPGDRKGVSEIEFNKILQALATNELCYPRK
jgi:hypothetical protein